MIKNHREQRCYLRDELTMSCLPLNEIYGPPVRKAAIKYFVNPLRILLRAAPQLKRNLEPPRVVVAATEMPHPLAIAFARCESFQNVKNLRARNPNYEIYTRYHPTTQPGKFSNHQDHPRSHRPCVPSSSRSWHPYFTSLIGTSPLLVLAASRWVTSLMTRTFPCFP